uniref:Uncharacterized protein n=1 Tax=Parascaris equorum TaxID=6256 RepID=A0A914RSX8_PAREQ
MKQLIEAPRMWSYGKVTYDNDETLLNWLWPSHTLRPYGTLLKNTFCGSKRMCGGRHLSEPYDWENDYVEVFTDILSYTDS